MYVLLYFAAELNSISRCPALTGQPSASTMSSYRITNRSGHFGRARNNLSFPTEARRIQAVPDTVVNRGRARLLTSGSRCAAHYKIRQTFFMCASVFRPTELLHGESFFIREISRRPSAARTTHSSGSLDTSVLFLCTRVFFPIHHCSSIASF